LDFAEQAFHSRCQITMQFIWILSAIVRLDFDKEQQICPSIAPVTCCKFHSSWSICTIPWIIWS